MGRPRYWKSPKWQRVRRDMFVSAGFACSACGWTLPDAPEDYSGKEMLGTRDADGRGRCLEIDHVRPVARGGDNRAGNLQVLCSRCNASKNARTMKEWAADG